MPIIRPGTFNEMEGVFPAPINIPDVLMFVPVGRLPSHKRYGSLADFAADFPREPDGPFWHVYQAFHNNYQVIRAIVTPGIDAIEFGFDHSKGKGWRMGIRLVEAHQLIANGVSPKNAEAILAMLRSASPCMACGDTVGCPPRLPDDHECGKQTSGHGQA